MTLMGGLKPSSVNIMLLRYLAGEGLVIYFKFLQWPPTVLPILLDGSGTFCGRLVNTGREYLPLVDTVGTDQGGFLTADLTEEIVGKHCPLP